MMALPVLIAQLTAQLLAAGCPLQPALEISHVHVIDVLTGTVSYDATVTIDAGRFCEITGTRKGESRARRRIEGRGRYALPGLWLNPGAGVDPYSLLGYGVTQLADGALPNAGTDELYDELVQLSAVGFSPLQVLQALTWKAAQQNGADSGLVAAGFEASVILLEENPLDDIAHLRSVSLVIQRGQPHGLVELARARAGRENRWQPFVR